MPTRVLIVVEKDFRFVADTPSARDFTFNTLVNALTGAAMQVTKAYRKTGMETDANADINATEAGRHSLLELDGCAHRQWWEHDRRHPLEHRLRPCHLRESRDDRRLRLSRPSSCSPIRR